MMKIRWGRGFRAAAAGLVAVVLAALLAYETGLVDRWVKNAVVQRIEEQTGTRVELRALHLHHWGLRAELEDLTVHGLEGPGAAPLFHATHMDAEIRIISFFGGQIALEKLIVDQPQVSLQYAKDGTSNLPLRRTPPAGYPWRQTLFDLRIQRLELRDGGASINNRQIPLEIRGHDMAFQLHYDAAAAGKEAYVGNLRWQKIEFAERRDLPVVFDFSAKFTLHRDSFELDELICKLPHSELDLRAELPSFSKPDWKFRYRGRLALADARAILRNRSIFDATVEFSGQAQYVGEEWTAGGHYTAREITLPFQWFHARDIETWGDYELAKKRLVVPKMGVREFGGSVDGRLEVDLDTWAFRTQTHVHGDSLAAALGAVDNVSFPVHTFHWDAAMDVESVNTWRGAFQHFRSVGHSTWAPPAKLGPGKIPVTADIYYDYFADRRGLLLQPSTIDTPNTKLRFSGTLVATDSTLNLDVAADDLLDWDEFINVVRGKDAEPKRIAGKVTWHGRILGPIAGPTFTGHLHAENARYDRLGWDEIDGEMEYSPDAFHLTNTRVRRGRTAGLMDVALALDGDWSFRPIDAWSVSAQVQHAPTADLQEFFATNYPVEGYLSGSFHVGGTQAAPVFDSHFLLENFTAKGAHFDRASGDLHLEHDEYRLSKAELRKDAGRLSGDVLYRPAEIEVEFSLAGAGIPLEAIPALQNPSLPIQGQLEFNVRGSGPLMSPKAEGEIHLRNIQAGSDRQGDVHGRLRSDGQSAHLSFFSEFSRGKISGDLDVGLKEENRLAGLVSVTDLDMDALISSGLHLKRLTGHSSVTGVFQVKGALRQPDTLEVDANIQKISLNYEFVQIENKDPIRLTYRRNEVRIEQAHLYGPNTDLRLNGSARFDRERPVHLSLTGGVNLRFLAGMIPELRAQGGADVNASVEGTLAKPRITGRASVRDGSANYSDFPVGLSHLNGDLVFDRSRLLFEQVTAESGGGQLILSGNVSYGEGPIRYEINVGTNQTRIRYPAGMSWLAGGTLQLAGTSDAAVLSGNVEVRRLLMSEGTDLASFFANTSQAATTSTSSSPFLRNLAFDIGGHTGPGARIEWSGAHVDIDGDLRLRGTWDRPILLGHIHLLGGEMAFRGNNFTLTRGDVNFANPFELNPEINIEATSVISQYQVTINFSGKASKLTLSYRSDPPLPDTDIIALLAIGSTGQESALRSQGGAGSQNYGATALLSEAISSGLGGRVEKLFGISHFRVDPFLAGTATESNAAARVTIQQQVTRDLSITYSTNAATSNQYQLIQVEYAVKHDLSVIFLRDINGTYGWDVKFVRHFK